MASLNDDTVYASTAAANPGLAGVADLAATAGFRGNAATLRAASSLTARDGVYYNRALNTVVIYQAGVTLDGVDFRGSNVLVQADNVTIRNALFDARTGMAAVNAAANTSGLTIDRSTFDGLKLDRTYADFVASFGRNTTMTNNAFLNAPSDAIYIENGRVANNYIAGGGYQTGAHADGIWIGRTTGAVTIEGNLIDWRSSADARVATNNAVRITAENGNTANVQVRGNVLLGGSYTVSVTEIVGDRGNISGVSVTGNVIDSGQFGGLYMKDQPADLVYSGNVAGTGPARTFGAAALGSTVASLSVGATLITGTAGADALAAGA
ncbi:calcium-binding protein, partial [Methylobacterium trifolii]